MWNTIAGSILTIGGEYTFYRSRDPRLGSHGPRRGWERVRS